MLEMLKTFYKIITKRTLRLMEQSMKIGQSMKQNSTKDKKEV